MVVQRQRSRHARIARLFGLIALALGLQAAMTPRSAKAATPPTPGGAAAAGAGATVRGDPAQAAPTQAAPSQDRAVQIKEAPGEARPTAAAAAAAAQKLTPDTIATAKKPKGFRYSILRDVWVDEVGETLLYVKKKKRAKTNKAVPIPKDRALLASCIAGGEVADLKRSAIITVKFDPAGVVRPQIVINQKAKLESLHGKVLDIGGPKLYIALDDHSKRGFAVKSYADWDAVVQNGSAKDLKRGVAVTVRFDPSGEQGIKITLDAPPTAAPASQAKPEHGGCGCSVFGRAHPGVPAGAWLLALAAAALWLRRRQLG